MNLLLIDILARLPYGVVLDIDTSDWKAPQGHIKLKVDGVGVISKNMSLIVNGCYYGEKYKPYLRSMEDMTREERYELREIIGKDVEISDGSIDIIDSSRKCFSFLELQAVFNWLNKNMFDYMGLIPMRLAIKVTKENNPYEK